MIPAATLARLAVLGLAEAQAEAVAAMLVDVEAATKQEAAVAIEARRASDREKSSRYRFRRSMSDREWQGLRRIILERDGNVCGYCARETLSPAIDHIIPLIKGGTNEVENLIVACAECNSSKAGQTPEEWGRLPWE